ncbi:hypothetical protein [Corynebacterium efficiens YS-314]|uniref:Uncharacterized protein n=1 Tax=Corynebacterium efficiens (strain DSM 44549 / YS-314 / AJ 12310 / JCM 11189 / NBRC 100395) TaxID=196164 RepID=Q8FP46_COREF|nr:hypothetical protein [Corynebacterium efficiens YS-314]
MPGNPGCRPPSGSDRHYEQETMSMSHPSPLPPTASAHYQVLRPLPSCVPRDAQFWRDCLARLLHRKVLGQDTIFYQADHTVLGFLVKLLWHVLDFPIYSDGTKPGDTSGWSVDLIAIGAG